MINGLAYSSIKPLDGGDGQETSKSTALVFIVLGKWMRKFFKKIFTPGTRRSGQEAITLFFPGSSG